MNKKGRSAALAASKQVIIKAGTRLLIDRESIARLVDGVAAIRKSGRKVLLVTSGAVGMGMETLKVKSRPRELAKIQALAAVGQSALMAIYSAECKRHGFEAAQLLLTAADLRQRERYLNVMNCINALWENGVLPIVNENDSVSVNELKFGDNDTLSAIVAQLVGADLLILLSDIDGLYDKDPHKFEDANIIDEVECITDEIRALAGGAGSSRGTGGMATKISAAEIATKAGADMIIANGEDPEVLYDIFDGKKVGTLFNRQ